jgi:hypothetical protein
MGILDSAASMGNSAVKSTIGAAKKAIGTVAGEKNILVSSGNNQLSKAKPVFKYPLTLEGQNHTSRLAFNATDFIQGNEGTSMRSEIFGNYKKMMSKNIGSVFLYMPELETSFAQNYNDDGRGLLWVLNNAVQNNGGYDNFFGKAGVAALKDVGAYELNKHAPNVMKDFYRQVWNQHNSANFTGTQLRRQKFQFDLRPRNPAELAQIAGMIKFFKENSATSLQGDTWLRVPSRWYIEEISNQNASRVVPLFKFGPAFLTNVEVDYTPDGSWKTFENGDPIAMKLTLEFMENTIVTREDIRNFDL